jgi:iron(III) transport system permease protein
LGRRVDAAQGGVEGRRRNLIAGVWIASLLAILGFLVVYPVLTPFFGALIDTNPVVEGLSLSHLSIAHFLNVAANPNVAAAVVNTLLACGGGRRLRRDRAVVLLDRGSHQHAAKGFIAAASMLALFAPPLVAGVAWSILGSPKTGLINSAFKWAGLNWRVGRALGLRFRLSGCWWRRPPTTP